MPSGVTAFESAGLGSFHSCAIASAGANAGKAYCWGVNTGYQLGDGTTTSRLVPTVVSMPSGATFTKIDSYGAHSCAF